MKRFLVCVAVLFLSTGLNAQNNEVPTPQWRPVYHFTPLKNWTNDPNGLLYLNGVYELYNQQNPYENKWGHMSWGHATSTDLVHWKHYPLAMPEGINGEDTTWRFSGSAVWDKDNTSGLCSKGGCIVAIYTGDQPHIKKESQYIAYSNDGGMSFTNYSSNPVIDLHKKDFRDPNVQWDDQINKWLMVVSLPLENKVQFYSSPDLKNWELLSEFGHAGLQGGIWECPFFIKLPVEGNAGKAKWVLVNSFQDSIGNDLEEYYVGDFDGKTFTNDNPPDKVLLVDHGNALYAAIPWNNLPSGQHTYIGWMVPPPQETYPWRGQMSIPRDLSLRETKDGIRLFQNPAGVIKDHLPQLSEKMVHAENLKVKGTLDDILKNNDITGNSYWLEAELEVPENTMAGFKIAQQKDKKGNVIAETVVGFDASKNEVYVDRSHSGEGKINYKKLTQIMNVSSSGGKIKLEILFDKSSLEVFVNDGEKVLTIYIYPDKDANLLSAFSFGGQSIIKSLKVWDMSK
jgi:levanase/fructan beta-fructosidase